MQSAIKAPFDRDRQYQAKRRAVILSAASAFRRRGYHNTSMVDIAKTLGLTKAALYYYVRNKEEILFESHIMAYDSMDEVLKTKKANNQSSLDYLEEVFREFVGLLTQSGVSLLTDVDSLSGNWQAEVLARRNKIERRVVKIVKDGQADGSIRSGDARLHVFFFMGALNWLNAWFDGEGRLKGEDIADQFVVQLRNGIIRNEDKG
jgi:AcrR family transcriptional regulator